MGATPIRIVIVDDSQVYRKTICSILKKEPGLRIVGEAEDGLAAIQAVETHRPGVVLMDISMPILNGFDATSIITTDFPDTKVIVLTMNTNKIFSDRACNAGACNFLAKDCDKEKLLSAIKHCSLR
jgi:DNA-binding NarL/FixJ family response regulator